MLTEKVLVLNKSWIPITFTSLRKALVMVYQGSARVVCPKSYLVFDFDSWIELGTNGGSFICTVSLKIPKMEVICLTGYNGIPHKELAFTKNNLFKRDNYTCQYCEGQPKKEDLTIDHVIPRSRGGKTTWENCVAACKKCNKQKGDKLLHETNLKLRKKPKQPRWDLEFLITYSKWKESWQKFLVKT